LLKKRSVLSGIRPAVGQAVVDVGGVATERDPGLKETLAGIVVQRPLHRHGLDVEGLAVVAPVEYLRAVPIGIARLDGIPRPVWPRRAEGAVGIKRGRPGIVRLLDLTAEIMIVDQIPTVVIAPQVSNGAT